LIASFAAAKEEKDWLIVIEIEAVEAVAVEAIIIAIKASWVLVNSSGNK
jgi:hypothetical protein